jgi:hypothetical protein
MSQTIMASMDTRFAVIEKEQTYVKQCISGVESKTDSISNNIHAMMAHWKITPSSYKRKSEADLDDSRKEQDMEYANHSMSEVQGHGVRCF